MGERDGRLGRVVESSVHYARFCTYMQLLYVIAASIVDVFCDPINQRR